ncbi:MAG: phosphoribosylformylglycinamidine synthase [Lentisphaeria bacterium]|nr:phosphoribosylformylglycinamidine synthase [Lentisphaeria bacterium]
MTNYRIEISPLPKWRDARGTGVAGQIEQLFSFKVREVRVRDVYTVSADITSGEAEKLADLLYNPVLQGWQVGATRSANFVELPACDYIIVVGFRPGVTDNVARTFSAAAADILGRKLKEDEFVASSAEYLIYGDGLTREQMETVGRKLLANELIQSVRVLSAEEAQAGIPLNLPKVSGEGKVQVREYDLEISDDALVDLSKKGTLALTLEEMKAIQNYFRTAEGREQFNLKKCPTDVELEVLAQTWSEHCKHKIFSANIDYENCETGEKMQINSCYKTFIQKTTRDIQKKVDYLVSVFSDNAGVIDFNDKCDVVYKVETHNSPSALDPYGGAMTGIVGVNRDPMGTGQGADLLINVWGYCFGSPFTDPELVPEGLLHPRRLRDGVHKGVIDGGNQSGIPYGNGWEFFDDRYIGKPLVYCGTVGKLPKSVNGIPGASKTINPGDLIVMGGGRIGKDGIHGATFSSEELHKDSPAQAVQIGDPITQKKLSDFIREARDRGLYRFITDNGAGGLSSSVGEMAELCNGCKMDLKKAPIKYAGLQPWEILVSEAQERMSFAVPPEKIEEFKALAAKRDVEVTVMGEFTDNGKFHIMYGDETVAYLDIEFMHSGLPKMQLKARWNAPSFPEPDFSTRNIGEDLAQLAGQLNLCSCEYKARQYDHEVKGLSVVKPYGGKCRDVAADATVTMIEPLSTEGVVLSSAILPHYGDIDTYHMTASTLDLAVRRAISVGGDMEKIAVLDNFCWPDPVQSEKTPDGEYKLAQLVRANQALADYTMAYLCPCISGKDSMKNDSTRGGRKISIPPSLLFSVIAKCPDIAHAMTLDAKNAGDFVYVIGETKAELGGSEYYNMLGFTGNNVPKVDAKECLATYDKVISMVRKDLAASLSAPGPGGLGMAFAKAAMAGRLGMKIDLDAIPAGETCSDAEKLYSESNGRFVATVNPAKAAEFEAALAGCVFAKVGVVTEEQNIVLTGSDSGENTVSLEKLVNNYKATLDQI